MLRRATPVLHVAHSVAAEAFYGGPLGFEIVSAYRPVTGHDDPAYLVVARDDAVLHLSSFRDDSVPGAAVNLYTDDVDALYQALAAAGVAGTMAPTDQSWGTREIYIEDPDGNSLRFVQLPPAS